VDLAVKTGIALVNSPSFSYSIIGQNFVNVLRNAVLVCSTCLKFVWPCGFGDISIVLTRETEFAKSYTVARHSQLKL